MNRETVNPGKRWTWFGVAYGCILFVFGFGSMGMGHGTGLPASIFGAPISIFPVLGWFVTPVWWGMFARMLSRGRSKVALTMLVIHTVAVILMLFLGTLVEYGADQWKYFEATERSMGVWLWSGIAFYVVGQVIAWGTTIEEIIATKARADR